MIKKEILPWHIQLIASFIDYPSVYMGGPSHHAERLARRIWEGLKAEGFVRELIDNE